MDEYEWEMKLKYPLLVLALLALLATPLTLSAASKSSPSSASYNWAGYLKRGAGYSGVEGSWVVPRVTLGTRGASHGTWVGVGGDESSDLIQAGTRALELDGVVSYRAWYEVLPAPATLLPMEVAAGDRIRVALRELTPDVWRIELHNETSGEHFATTLPHRSAKSSVEWIQEAPGSGDGTLRTLDRFAPITFSGAYATQAGKRVSLAALGATRLTLVDRSFTALATALPVGADGASFSIRRN